MSRLILPFWRDLVSAALPAIVCGLLLCSVKPLPAYAIGPAVVFGLLSANSARRLWQLYRSVRGFHTVSRGQLVLHYDPPLERRWDMAILLERCQAELDSLTRQFGFSLRGRIHVFLLSDIQSVSKLYGRQVGGFAMPQSGVLFLADCWCFPEGLRHELGHLFAARWNIAAPPLFNEGLAVWLQKTHYGQSFAAAARPLLAQRGLKLRLMLKPRFFFAEPQRSACYTLAGSFTDFLIRHYGWDRYRYFFRHSNDLLFHRRFQRCFGVSLDKAEWQWRSELTLMEILNRRLGRSTLS
jgi:hypothetical protein